MGCSIGDLGTIYLFQLFDWSWSPLAIMSLAMVNGLITSICLETTVLMTKDIDFKKLYDERLTSEKLKKKGKK